MEDFRLTYLRDQGPLTSGPLTAKETAGHQVRSCFDSVLLALAKPTERIFKYDGVYRCRCHDAQILCNIFQKLPQG